MKHIYCTRKDALIRITFDVHSSEVSLLFPHNLRKPSQTIVIKTPLYKLVFYASIEIILFINPYVYFHIYITFI